jgi:uncharacterized protein (DUF427 family)
MPAGSQGRRRDEAVWNEETVAETDKTVVVDGNHYFPPHTVDRRYLSESRMRSVCPWKGIARYYTIEANGERNPDAAWTYPRPGGSSSPRASPKHSSSARSTALASSRISRAICS